MSVIGFSNGLTKEQSIEKFKNNYYKENLIPSNKALPENYYSALWNLHTSRSEYLNNILDKLFQGHDRISFNSTTETDSENLYADELKELQEFLQQYEYVVEDYIAGMASKKNRKFKIGKLLERHQAPSSLIKMFSNSIYRTNSKKNNVFTLSRNVYDILTMSTFRGWTSCMNIARDNFSHVPVDIQYGTLIVYNHSPFDKDIENPSGRFLLKPYLYEDNGVISIFYKREDTKYGEVDSCWRQIGDEIEQYVNDILLKEKSYILGKTPTGIYRDDINKRAIVANYKEIDPETIDFDGDISLARKYMQYLECHDIAIRNPNLVCYIDVEKLTSPSLLSNLDFSSLNNILEDISQGEKYKNILKYIDIGKINIPNTIRIIKYLFKKDDEELIEQFMEKNIPSRLVIACYITDSIKSQKTKELFDEAFKPTNYFMINKILRYISLQKESYMYKLISDKINNTIDVNLYAIINLNYERNFIDTGINHLYALYDYSRDNADKEINELLTNHYNVSKENLSNMSSELRNLIRLNNFIGKEYKIIVDDQIVVIEGDM